MPPSRTSSGPGVRRRTGAADSRTWQRERILLRRTDLMRAFEKESASNVRVLDPIGEEIDGTVIDEPVVLLAETDLMLGGEAAPRLEDLARRVLGAPVEVISATALSLLNPERLERLVKASTPL